MDCRRICIVSLIFLSGCLGHQVTRDSSAARDALLTLYTDQAMDNLIRARLNQPFIQLTYGDVLVQETNTSKAETSNESTWSHSHTLAAAALTVGRMFSDTLSFTASSQHEGQLSLKASPVTDHNDIYEAYLALARDPSFLHESRCKPNFPVHICREHCGSYFWIPCDQGQLFLELVLKTSMMRGPETIPPPAYTRTIVKVAKVEQGDEGAINVWLQFSESVPNGSATMVFTMDGRKLRLKLRPYGEPKFGEDKVPNPGDDTKYLIGQWVPKDTGFGPDDLIQKNVSIYSDDYPAIAPTPLPQLQPLLDQVDRIRANQSLSPSL